MIDTHIHLDFESYNEDREDVIARFFQQGGKAVINIGTDEKRIEEALEIARAHENIYVAAGYHPQEGVDEYNKTSSLNFIEKIKEFAQKEKVVAIGEIGLDYFHPSATDYELKINHEIKEIQKKMFVRQLEIARELQLPVSVHSWDSMDDCWKIMKEYSDLKMVFHCYGRGIPIEFTQELLTHENIFFSFTGNITFPRPGKAGSEIWEHLKLIPLERMMVETDGPFLTPAPFRGKRNEPAYVKYVIEKIAEIKNRTFEEVEKVTDGNAIQFFNLNTHDV